VEIREQFTDDIVIMHVNRQIDTTTGPELGARLETVIGEGATHLILDLSDVPYISSAGLRVLSIALKTVRDSDIGGDLYLAALSKTVAHAFRISGFDQVFPIYETVPEAVEAMNASRNTDLGD
jgi:anti-sigma B factor antagonist